MLILFCLPFNWCKSQAADSSLSPIQLNAYAELYYSYDFSSPSNLEKPDFLYNHKRHNQVDFNLAFVKASYKGKNYRANLALMAGHYAQYNLSKEPSWAKLLFEANVGIKLSKKKELWLDAGIFPSHIGFESAVSADCFTLTRSMVAENSPYYESGIKLNYTTTTGKLNLSFLLLNGWQNISRSNAVNNPAIGVQINYKPNTKWVFNYSNFLGTDKPASQKALRTYHNFYATFSGTKAWSFIAGLDMGTDKYDANNYGVWFTPVAIARYMCSPKIFVAARAEYFNDAKQIIVSTGTIYGFKNWGLSANIDYAITNKILWRVEGKLFMAAHPIFYNTTNNNQSITTNLSIRL